MRDAQYDMDLYYRYWWGDEDPEKVNKLIKALPFWINRAEQLEDEIDRLRNEIDILQEQLAQRRVYR